MSAFSIWTAALRVPPTYDAVKQVKESKGLTSPHAYAYLADGTGGQLPAVALGYHGRSDRCDRCSERRCVRFVAVNKSLPGVTGCVLEDGTEVIP